tara:strand:- start:103 stop:909 length:807 start_codon:yes stop_codon:yes gene_type:complete
MNQTNSGYGIIQRTEVNNDIDKAVEDITKKGFSVVKSEFSLNQIKSFSKLLDSIQKEYINKYGLGFLKSLNEQDQIRLPMSFNIKFFNIAKDKNLNAILKQLIPGRYVLNQQNAVVNPPKKQFDQAKWHRDLPYQHYTSNRPLAINALLCLDEFNIENGATSVIPGSHLHSDFPSDNYVKENIVQLEAKKGDFLVLDSMLFHRAEKNKSNNARRAVNNVYGIPFFKQQINLKNEMKNYKLSKKDKELLGFDVSEIPSSVKAFLDSRVK